MTPHEHAQMHQRDFGGEVEDYLPIDEFLDSTKFMLPDYRHRALLHNPLGIAICERIFGAAITNSDGNEISVREIARRHITQDFGKVHSLETCINAIESKTFHKLNRPDRTELRWLRDKHNQRISENRLSGSRSGDSGDVSDLRAS